MRNERKDNPHSPLPPQEQKADYVRSMFNEIAARYDRMNALMSFGRDRAWRRKAIAAVCIPAGGSLLDVATGTGDLALEALRQQPLASVTGLDFSTGMLELARQKAATAAAQVMLVTGDALRLPLAAGSFDAIVTAFALRNVTDIPAAFEEMARVTRPGGRLACLEIAKPRSRAWRGLFALYFYRLVPLFGRWISGHGFAYTYLPHSLTRFLTPDEITAVLKDAGWSQLHCRRLMLGTIALHTATKP
jgi:demethylmenaquinone methyltransferase / 2-methoxy-6-polyprenyl-1,4-benzoquinol methylase